MSAHFHVIIIGGSYAGLAAALSLGRSVRNVLVIDSGKPCNRFTPHSQNFITHDGEQPAVIAQKAREQIQNYPTVQFANDTVTEAAKQGDVFSITTLSGKHYTAAKLLFATGVKDEIPNIEGLQDCWGISAIHCPYCHGYEYKEQPTGILGNGDAAYHYALLVHNLTPNLYIFTNGKADFTPEQLERLYANKITVTETQVAKVNHTDGYMTGIELADGTSVQLNAMYVRPKSTQHNNIPEKLGCPVNEQGLITVDMMQKTNLPGIYAAGDCCTPMRSVSSAVAQGNMAGAAINAELCGEVF